MIKKNGSVTLLNFAEMETVYDCLFFSKKYGKSDNQRKWFLTLIIRIIQNIPSHVTPVCVCTIVIFKQIAHLFKLLHEINHFGHLLRHEHFVAAF